MERSSNEAAINIAEFLDKHKGIDTVVLDLANRNSWTDIFIITTVMSHGHMTGLYRNLLAYLDEIDLSISRKNKRPGQDGWVLIDCGSIIIHLMNAEMRGFYELEKLWFDGTVIYHSSKSS